MSCGSSRGIKPSCQCGSVSNLTQHAQVETTPKGFSNEAQRASGRGRATEHRVTTTRRLSCSPADLCWAGLHLLMLFCAAFIATDCGCVAGSPQHSCQALNRTEQKRPNVLVSKKLDSHEGSLAKMKMTSNSDSTSSLARFITAMALNKCKRVAEVLVKKT